MATNINKNEKDTMMLNTWFKRILIVGLMTFSVTISFSQPMAEQTLQGGLAFRSGDYAEAFKLLTEAAEAGNSNASEILAEMYYNGQGVKQDYKKAYALLQPALKEGYPEANYFLGQMYYFGNGVAEDKQKAIGLYTKAANAGYTKAQIKLADLYGTGKTAGMKNQNIPMTYYWYNLSWINGASDDNDMSATFAKFLDEYPYCIALGQDNVGQAYYQGIGGLDKSASEALDWMQKAAETDPNLGVVNLDLAKMYHVNGDDDKAFEFAQKAVKSPYAPAMQYLGTMYQKGIGTDKDPVKAYAYLTLAVELYNDPDAKFYSKYAAPCMPNYQQTTKEFNVDVAKQQLEQISLNGKQKEQANKLIEQVKANFSK